MKTKTHIVITVIVSVCIAIASIKLPAYAQIADGTPEPDSAIQNSSVFLPFIIQVTGSDQAPTPVPTTGLTPEPTPSPTPGSTPVNPPGSTIFYISPNGNDFQSGLSESLAWRTFEHAWNYLDPGDTLVLMDGIYDEPMFPKRSGEPGRPITVMALNDGKAIIDAHGQDIPLYLDKRSYLEFIGLVVKNGTDKVIFVNNGHYNTFRRISAYNADTNLNSSIISLTGNNNLVEDCVMSGPARKLGLIYSYGVDDVVGNYNTFRRCFAAWQEWKGEEFCGSRYPNGKGFQSYNADNNTFENVISFGRTPRAGIDIMAQSYTDSVNNYVLGSVLLRSGKNLQGEVIDYGTRVACDNNLIEDNIIRAGINLYLDFTSTMNDIVLRDILAFDNAKAGVGTFTGEAEDVVLDHATLVNNDPNVDDTGLQHWNISNSYIVGTQYKGEGARLTRRYVDRVLTNDPLWPWPMESRIQQELGISITCEIGSLINEQYAQGHVADQINPAIINAACAGAN